MGYRNYIGVILTPADGAAPGIYSVLDVYQDILDGQWPSSPVLPTEPTAVTATPSFRQIAASWSAPLNLSGQTVIEYKVSISTTTGTVADTTTEVTTSGTSYTFTNLTNDTRYAIRVAAVTSSGTGAYSSGVIATPFASLAAAPTAVTATATGRSVALSWTAGTAGTTATSDYLVQYSTDGAVTWINTDDGNSSATSASFINLVPSQTYVFRVAAVNAQGTGPWSNASNAVTIVVPIITITTQPASAVAVAEAATFSVEATVTQSATLSYQWYLISGSSATAISGATSATLSLTGLVGEDNGKTFQCVISTTGGGDSVTTNAVSLTVVVPTISIDTQPAPQTASGGAATFSVAASIDQGATLSYQWQRGVSGTYSNLSGKTSSTLSLTGLTFLGNNGNTYRCVVSGTGGASSVTTDPATLTVPAPVISITAQPSDQTAVSRAAEFSVTATVTDGATLSYQWQRPVSGTFSNISGATSATLSLSSLLFTVNDQQLYRCVVSATDGASSVVSSTATLTVPAPVITITAQPTAQTSSNQTASFSVSATVTDGQTLSYQWQRQAGAAYSNLAGKTSATLSLTGLTNTANDGDYYRCVVSATDGATPVNSDGAALTVPVPVITIGTQPTAQTAIGGAASFSVAATITNGASLSYQWQRQALGTGSYSNLSGATSATLSLTGLTNLGNDQDNYRCVVSGTDNASSVTSSAATLTAPAPVITITAQPTAQTSSNQTATFSVAASVTAGATLSYQWQRQALGTGSYANVSGQTSATLSLTGLTNAANNADNYRCVVSATDGATNVTSTAVALTVPVPVITITAQPTAQTTTDIAAFAVYSVSATVTNGATLSYQWQRQPSGGSFSNISGQTSSSLTLTGLTFASNNADNYRCVVSASDNASPVNSSSASLTVTQTPVITITAQPSNQTASGGAATFSVTATITLSATLSYQWQRQALGTGSYANVSGGTSASLSLTGLTAGSNNGDNYRCLVSGSGGAASVTSSAATLTVASITAPSSPTGLSATAGNAQVALSWTAPSSNGGASITGYAITYSGGTVNTGSTNTSFTVTGLTNGTAYSFTVAAINSAGTGTASSSASATPRTVPGAPTALSATAGNAQVALSWTAPSSNGGASITGYAITYSGGTINTGSSSTSYTVTGLTNGTAYSFTVAATNAAGTGTASSSASATPATVPGAPTGLSGTAGDTQVPLTWTAPSSNGGASITGYVVEWAPSGGSASTVNTGSTSTSYTRTGLTNGTAVTFRVAAVNSVGTGAYSSSVTVTPAGSSGATFTNVSGDAGFSFSGANTSTLNYTFDPTSSGTVNQNALVRNLNFTISGTTDVKMVIPEFGGNSIFSWQMVKLSGATPQDWQSNKDGTSNSGIQYLTGATLDSSLSGTAAGNNRTVTRGVVRLSPGNYRIRMTFGGGLGSFSNSGWGYNYAAVSASMTLGAVGAKVWQAVTFTGGIGLSNGFTGVGTDTIVGTGRPTPSSAIRNFAVDSRYVISGSTENLNGLSAVNLPAGPSTLTFNRVSGSQSSIVLQLNAGSYSANGWSQSKEGWWTTTNLSSATSITLQSATTQVRYFRLVGPTSGTNAQRMHTVELVLS